LIKNPLWGKEETAREKTGTVVLPFFTMSSARSFLHRTDGCDSHVKSTVTLTLNWRPNKSKYGFIAEGFNETTDIVVMQEGMARYMRGDAAIPIRTRNTYMLDSGRSRTIDMRVAALSAPEAAAFVTLHENTPVTEADETPVDTPGVSRMESGGGSG
jgi:hypothetical protein